MGTERTSPSEGGNDENAKRTRSLHKSPNDRRKKKQYSLISMEYKDKLEAEVKQMGLAMELLDDTTGDAAPTLNKNTPTPQHHVLLGVSVKDSDITGVQQDGSPVNNQAMGASLAILQNQLLPQLKQNNNSNSQVQHVLISPSTLRSIPTTFTGLEKTIRKKVSDQLDLPTFGTLTKAEYQQGEMKLRILAPVRDNSTDPDRRVYQWGLLVIEMHKHPGESQCGCRTQYFHSAHEVANDDQ